MKRSVVFKREPSKENVQSIVSLSIYPVGICYPLRDNPEFSHSSLPMALVYPISLGSLDSVIPILSDVNAMDPIRRILIRVILFILSADKNTYVYLSGRPRSLLSRG